MSIRHGIFGVLVAALVFVPPLAAAAMRVEKVTVETPDGPVAFDAEIADTPDLREQGLMFRQSLGDDKAMLFIFEDTRRVGFWMKNTPLSLDLIFIRHDGTIAGIHEAATPFDETVIPSPEPVRAVMEVKGGLSGSLGIRPGQEVRHAVFE